MNTQNNWEERFEAEAPLAFGGREWAKNFIREALASQRETLAVEIEGMKKDRTGEFGKTRRSPNVRRNIAYNRGLTDAAAHIRKQ